MPYFASRNHSILFMPFLHGCRRKKLRSRASSFENFFVCLIIAYGTEFVLQFLLYTSEKSHAACYTENKDKSKRKKRRHSMAEYLDIVDKNGIPTGETVERETAHAKGFRHRPRLTQKHLRACLPAIPNYSKRLWSLSSLLITPDFISREQISKTHHISKRAENRMKIPPIMQCVLAKC